MTIKNDEFVCGPYIDSVVHLLQRQIADSKASPAIELIGLTMKIWLRQVEALEAIANAISQGRTK